MVRLKRDEKNNYMLKKMLAVREQRHQQEAGVPTTSKEKPFMLAKCIFCLGSSRDVENLNHQIVLNQTVLTYAEIIYKCFSLDFYDDGEHMPCVCNDCIQKLIQAYNFKILLVNSWRLFKDKNKVIKEEEPDSTNMHEDSEEIVVKIEPNEALIDIDEHIPSSDESYDYSMFEGSPDLVIDVENEGNNSPETEQTDSGPVFSTQVPLIKCDKKYQIRNPLARIENTIDLESEDNNLPTSVINSNNVTSNAVSNDKDKRVRINWVVHTALEKCLLCRHVFKDFSDKIIHLNNEHNIQIELPDNMVLMTCDICGFIACDKCQFLNHYKMQHDEPCPKEKLLLNRCPICRIYFSNGVARRDHLRFYHCTDIHGNYVANDTWKQCDHCQRTIHSLIDEIIHMYNVHGLDMVSELVPPKGLVSRCIECKIIFKYKFDYTTHLIQKHGNQNAKSMLNYQITCSMCGILFALSFIEKHRQTYHNISPSQYKCEICSEHFSGKKALNSHIYRKHKEHHLDYVCNFCNKKFAMEHHLKRHMHMHTDIRSYPCNVCGRAYKRKFTLEQHMKIHNSVKEFNCTQCKIGFTYKCSLKAHLEKIHKTN